VTVFRGGRSAFHQFLLFNGWRARLLVWRNALPPTRRTQIAQRPRIVRFRRKYRPAHGRLIMSGPVSSVRRGGSEFRLTTIGVFSKYFFPLCRGRGVAAGLSLIQPVPLKSFGVPAGWRASCVFRATAPGECRLRVAPQGHRSASAGFECAENLPGLHANVRPPAYIVAPRSTVPSISATQVRTIVAGLWWSAAHEGMARSVGQPPPG